MELVVAETARAAARGLAGRITVLARQAMGRRGVCNLVVGSGPEASALFAALVDTEIFWGRVDVFQADEIVAPAGDPRRVGPVLVEELAEQVGLPQGRLHLIGGPGPGTPGVGAPAGPDAAGPDGAARRQAAALPERLDVVQLGIDDDGRVVGWHDGDPALGGPEPFAVVGPPDGVRRIVVTPAGVERAEHRFALVTGSGRAAALARLQTGAAGAAGAALASLIVYTDRAATGG